MYDDRNMMLVTASTEVICFVTHAGSATTAVLMSQTEHLSSYQLCLSGTPKLVWILG